MGGRQFVVMVMEDEEEGEAQRVVRRKLSAHFSSCWPAWRLYIICCCCFFIQDTPVSHRFWFWFCVLR